MFFILYYSLIHLETSGNLANSLLGLLAKFAHNLTRRLHFCHQSNAGTSIESITTHQQQCL